MILAHILPFILAFITLFNNPTKVIPAGEHSQTITTRTQGASSRIPR